MRRISLALALFGAMAAAGCGGGAKPSSTAGTKGTAGINFTVTINNQGGGTVSDGAQTCAANTTCTWTYPSGTAVNLTETAGSLYFNGWFGDCNGTTCSLSGNSDKYVVAYFSTSPQAHPNWAAGHPTNSTLNCSLCHGSAGTGLGIAPSCAGCHSSSGGAIAKTGLVATVTNISVTAPVTVSFTLADNAGKPVDISSASKTNLPLSNCGHGASLPSQGCSNTTIGFALGYFSVNGSGIVSPYTVYPAGSAPTMQSVTVMGTSSKGTLTQVSPGSYTYTFPAASGTIAAAQNGNTHTFFMYATRQENMTGGACTGTAGAFTSCPSQADDSKGYTAVNVIYNFDPTTGAAVTAKREIVTAAACNKCHDGFQPKGAVSSAFHSGNKVDGRICNVCHNPARTSNPFANSAQAFHRIHAYAEEGMPAFACMDEAPAATGTQPTPGQWTPLAAPGTTGVYAGGGTPAVTPASATDTSVCNATNYPSPIVPKVVAVAFDATGLDLTYPQDIRNCDECHGGAAQGAQWNTNPSPVACNSCHANSLKYWYGTQASIDSEMSGSAAFFVPGCTTGQEAACIQDAHPKLAVSPPDAQGCLLQNGAQPAGCNSNTNAAYLANAGQVPVGADQWTYNVTNVALDANGKPQISFQMLKNGTAVPFDACPQAGIPDTGGIGELYANYYGAPSVYFVFAVAQDGISAPADFNGSASGFLKAICFEGHTSTKGTSAATITAGANSTYTVTLTYTTNLSTAGIKMLTGGLGYTYGPASTPPLTQTGLSSFPLTVYNVTSGTVYGNACSVGTPCATKTGGLVVPIKNQWKVGTGFTGRRVIVDNARCDTCHGRLGARPTFHAGQRNDAPTCSFCHNPSQGSGGWSANASTFVHGVHGTDIRTVKFAWEGGCNVGATFVAAGATPAVPAGAAAVPAAGGAYTTAGACIDNLSGLEVAPRFYYPEVTYPGTVACSECHVDGFLAQTQAAAPNLLWTTYAKGTYPNGMNLAVSYVNTTASYGTGFSFSAATGATTARTGANLVGSPIAAACFSCHDSADAMAHMTGNGGHIYEAASTAMVNLNSEKCLGCHGSGGVADIAKVHP